MEPKELNLDTYIEAFKRYGIAITGGTIHQFLRESKVKYYGGKCPVYYVETIQCGQNVSVGGKYASQGKPQLKVGEKLNF